MLLHLTSFDFIQLSGNDDRDDILDLRSTDTSICRFLTDRVEYQSEEIPLSAALSCEDIARSAFPTVFSLSPKLLHIRNPEDLPDTFPD